MTPHIIETIVITLVLVFLVVLISLIVRDGFNFYKKYLINNEKNILKKSEVKVEK